MTDLRLKNFTVVFDLDGTLVDTAPDLIGATNHVLARVGLTPRPGEELRPWISFGARRMIEEALSQSGRSLTSNEVDELLELFLDHYESNIAHGSRPFPYVVDQMLALTQAGSRLGICTNKREALTMKLLDALDLTAHFQAIVGRDTLAVSKPHPEHLLETIRRAGGDPTRAIMVGDSGVDVATARAARVPVIGVSFGYSETPISVLEPDLVLDDYGRLTEAVAALAGRL
ncbi:MAG: phosphoglycolate phosphatase [Hyphomicrobiaceae bacterium]|nr:phosphoglycolate phosphatase [Hyphomicrobiaceae bacterium]